MNGKEVGVIELETKGSQVVVESLMIDFHLTRQGIGTAVVALLKERYTQISGCSSPLALNFWKKVGAEFEYEVNDEMVEYLLDIDEYPPFRIKC